MDLVTTKSILSAHPWVELSDGILPSSIRSMITPEEQKLLFYLASQYYQGEGVIADVGTFVGASTWLFGEGIKANQFITNQELKYQKPIYCFDIYKYNEAGDSQFMTEEAGSSFFDEFKCNVSKISEMIEVYVGDVCSFSWSNHLPIEILFIDVCKTYTTNKCVVNKFFPQLIPGRSVVIQQDYCDINWWIHLTMEVMSPYFEKIEGLVGCSQIFLNTKPIPHDPMTLLEQLTWDEKIQLLEKLIIGTRGFRRRLLLLSLASIYISAGKLEQAKTTILEVGEYQSQSNNRLLHRRYQAMCDIIKSLTK